MKKILAALFLALSTLSALAQSGPPPAVPALPDQERRTTYSITAGNCSCAVGFALYGDSTDYQSWVEVFLNGTRLNFNDPTFGWTITSPTGPLATIPRPITDGILTFTSAQTGTVQIVGARRPRRTSQFTENRGVAARDLNQTLTDIIATSRETWDKTNDITGRALLGLPGETLKLLPSATARANQFLFFDGSGNPTVTNAGLAAGSVIGPLTTTVGDLAIWNSTNGTLLKDAGSGSTLTGAYSWSAAQNYTITDPASVNSPGQTDILNVNANYDNSIFTVLGPQFNQANAIDITLNASHGNYSCCSPNLAKTTFIGLNINETFQAAGQRNMLAGNINCYGMGDCSVGQWLINVASAPRAGDEGTGYGLASNLQQVTPLQLLTVTGVSRNTCNTTTTQSISFSTAPQTVNVVSGTGCTVGTWVVVNHSPASNVENQEAVKITASTSTSITGIFTYNQSSGVTVTPAVDLTYSGAGGSVGEGRVLVDTTATPYTTGTVTGVSGGQLIGTATAWSSAMLTGGTTIVPGCISLAADDFTGSPYGAGAAALHDWYQITIVTDTTHLSILSNSAAGASNYKGKGPGSGGYTVRPCAEVLRILNGGEAILDTNGFAWATNDVLDISLPPYPDTSGDWRRYAYYSSGGTLRTMIFYDNVGARKFGNGIRISSDSGAIGQGNGADATAFGVGVLVEAADVGFQVGCSTGICSQTSSILLPGGAGFGQGSNLGSRIVWGFQNAPTNSAIGMGLGVNGSLAINFNGSTTNNGILDGKSTGIGGTFYMTYGGAIQIPAVAMANGPGSSIVTCSGTTEGLLQSFNDSTTATVGATILGFGTNHVLGRCNGTNWIVASP